MGRPDWHHWLGEVVPCRWGAPARTYHRELGRPLHAADLFAAKGDRRMAVDAIDDEIATLLPADYRGVYASL